MDLFVRVVSRWTEFCSVILHVRVGLDLIVGIVYIGARRPVVARSQVLASELEPRGDFPDLHSNWHLAV